MPGNRTHTRKSEEVRIRHLYRRLILQGKIKLPYEAAVKLVGPDCAYHLYSVLHLKSTGSVRAAKQRKAKADRA